MPEQLLSTLAGNPIFILVIYAFLGGGIKYIDQAYDLEVFSRNKANFMAIPTAVLMAFLMIFDPPSTTILFSVLLIVAITKKIDNIAFYIGTAILLLLPVIFHDVLRIEWLPFGILVFSGILDEIGNDWADKRRKKKMVNNARNNLDDSLPKNIGESFFLRRFTMKIALLALTIAGLFHYIYFFAFLLFDMMYFIMEQYSFHIKRYSLTG
jgi:hypothetical protein